MKRRTQITALVSLLVVAPWCAGCGVIFGGTRQTLRATSSPDGTTVTTTPGTVDYKTPTSLSLERRHEYILTFSMPGYTEQKVEVQRSIRGGILVLDVLAGLVGVVIDAATGGWYKLSPETVTVTLTKVNASVAGPDTLTVAIDTRKVEASGDVTVRSSEPGVSVHVDAQ